MTAETAAPAIATPLLGTLQRRALSLGTANAFDYAMQFLLPVVLARCLAPAAFGQYRLLWLAIMTVMAIAPLSIPQGLYYFLPRSTDAEKRLYVHQALLYLGCAGLAGAWVLSSWNPLLPSGMQSLMAYGALVPALVMLWVVTYLLDLLPTIEERVGLQARITISLSVLRATTLATVAYLTGDLRLMIWMLVGLATFKLLILVAYVARRHGLSGPWFQRRAFLGQFRHAAPFGVSSALYALRGQADQWVAATLFSLGNFASFSIAAVLGPLVNMFRLSVNHAFLPSMSRLHAADNLSAMLELNSRANVMVALIAYPMLAFCFAFADDIVTLVYTAAYVDAAQVMRVYILGLAAFVVELVSIMLLLKDGQFVVRLNLVLLAVSVVVSWFAANLYGLAGAAVGSVVVIYLDRFATLMHIAKRVGIPLKHLQDWKTLVRLLLLSVLAAALSWVICRVGFATTGRVVRLVAGGLGMAVIYAAMNCGTWRHRLQWASPEAKA